MSINQELNNGKEIKILTALRIDNVDYTVCELNTPRYIDEILVKYIVIHPNNFKEYVESVRKDSDEITVRTDSTTEIVVHE